MIPWFQFTTIQLGPVPIQVWGLFVAIALGVSLLICYKRAPKYGLSGEKILDHALWGVIGALIMTRLFHVVLYEPAFYLEQPLEIFKLWNGGASSFGAMIGGVLGIVLYAKKEKYTKETLIKTLDIFGFSVVFGWLIGRIGCFCIHDHLGMPCDCAVAIQTPDGPRLEMALLEIIGLIPIAIAFILIRKKTYPAGTFPALFFVYYGILRFILDFFRIEDAQYFGLTPAQYFATLMVIVGAIWLYKLKGYARGLGTKTSST